MSSIVVGVVVGVTVSILTIFIQDRWQHWNRPLYATSKQDLPPGISEEEVQWCVHRNKTYKRVLVGPLKRSEWHYSGGRAAEEAVALVWRPGKER